MTLCGGLAVSNLAAGLISRPAWASDLSLSERVDLLYSNQFQFNEKGRPQITVGLMQGQDEVVLRSSSGIGLLPSGDGGTSIEGGRRIRIRLAKAKPAKQRFSISLESFHADEVREVERAAKRWKSLGLTPSERETGTLFGVRGRVIDTRRIVLTAGDYSSEDEARRQARVLRQRHDALGALHPRVERRAEGKLIAEDLDHGFSVTAEGVLWFSPSRGATLTVQDVLHSVVMDDGDREERSYRGQIYVAIDRFGKLSVVNLVSEADLLAGLVPAEIYPTADHAALCAQSIAARGQLLTKIGHRHLDDPFLLCAHQHCQVYAGLGHEHPRATQAVRDTIGKVLMRPGGKVPVDTVYSANSGGHTEHNEHVWPSPRDAQLRGRPDPMLAVRYRKGIRNADLREFIDNAHPAHCNPDREALANSYRWTATVDPNEIAGRPGVPKSLGKLREIEVLSRGRSGRATAVRLVGKGGASELHGELRIRRALGGLKSSLFVIDGTDRFGRMVLRGAGHGHGVGLCQQGAMGMARAGHDHAEILTHYYRDAELAQLWK